MLSSLEFVVDALNKEFTSEAFDVRGRNSTFDNIEGHGSGLVQFLRGFMDYWACQS
jgi:hypothetical protein